MLPVGVGVGVGVALTVTLSDATTAATACADDPVAVRVRVRLAVLVFGATTCASSSTDWPAITPTEQVAVPGTGQTVKVGESLPGCAAMSTVTFPVVVVSANQTQIA